MSSTQKPRAPRFQIETPVYYREKGQAEWSEGTTINISRSGVLFRAARDLDPDTTISLRIHFPDEEPPVNVLCSGRIVRKEPPQPPETRPAVAAAILNYRLMRDKFLDALGL